MNEHTDSPTCTFHPDRPTLLRCTRCDRPACPDCLRPAAVGMHCTACLKEQSKAGSNVARELTAHQRKARRPGWLFWTMIAAFAALCVALASMTYTAGVTEASGLVKTTVFVTIVLGWLISLCLHEWAHAFVAYKSGDYSVLGRGYLTLDIRKYTDMVMSVLLPLGFLAMGGIPLPGGAVWINHGNIPSKHRQSAVSAAGPAMNILFGLVLLMIVRTGVFDGVDALRVALVFLAWLEFLTAAINLLPIPGLDGFGIIRPYLPYNIQVVAMQMATWAILLLFLVMIQTNAFSFLADISTDALAAAGGSLFDAEYGQRLFRSFSFLGNNGV